MLFCLTITLKLLPNNTLENLRLFRDNLKQLLASKLLENRFSSNVAKGSTCCFRRVKNIIVFKLCAKQKKQLEPTTKRKESTIR